jgi:hypothetical protein
MRARLTGLIVVLSLLATPVFGHHSVSEYDMTHPTSVTGVVERLEWTNPHAYIYLTAKNEKGVDEEWAIEINSPNYLKHNGWTSTTVKAGDTVTCTGGRAKNGARTMRTMTVTLSNGLVLRG